jgi:hypothetical protein
VLTRDSDKKAQKQAAKDAEREAAQAEKERQEFLASPVGQARTAYEAGDLFFQFAAPISETKRTVMAVLGGSKDMTKSETTHVMFSAKLKRRAGSSKTSAMSSNRPDQSAVTSSPRQGRPRVSPGTSWASIYFVGLPRTPTALDNGQRSPRKLLA